MSKQTAAVVVLLAITAVWVGFMARVWFDASFKPPEQLAAVGPTLAIAVAGYLFGVGGKKGEER